MLPPAHDFPRRHTGPGLRLALACAAFLALLAPGEWSQLFGGLPLGAWSLVAVALALFATAALPAPAARLAVSLAAGFVLVAALKLLLVALTPPVGFESRYWAAPTATDAAPERSTDFPALPAATRVDLALAFRGDDFPIHFVNDAARFNFGADVRPARDGMPFTVQWDGVLAVPADGVRRLVLESVGPASLAVDGREVVVLGAVEGDQVGEVRLPLATGGHALHVAYTRPEARVPRLRLAWEPTPGAPLETLGAPAVVRDAGHPMIGMGSGMGAATLAAAGAAVDVLLALLLAAWLVVGLAGLPFSFSARSSRSLFFSRPVVRAALAAVPLLFLGYGMAVNWDRAGRATVLSGLDDWLSYESSARDILLNGPSMTDSLGHASPYYAQPLYAYALAVAHALTGESIFGPLVLQYAALGLVLVATAALGARLFGRTVGLAAFALFWAFLQQEHLKVARALFTENLYMPLVMASLLVLVGLSRRRGPPAWWASLLAGGLLGLTAVTRSQFLLFVPVALVLLLVAWRRGGGPWARSLPALAGVLIGLAVAIAPFTFRNWLVSGQPVLIASSGGASLLEFHRPPRGFDLSGIKSDPLYQAVHLDASTRTVVEFARKDPIGYVGTLVPLAGHTIGVTGLRQGAPSVYWGFLATFLVYLGGFAFRRARRLDVWLVHAFVATHLLVMAFFEADTYGFRLVIPMYAPVAVVAALTLVECARWCARVGSRAAFAARRATSAIGLAAAGGACLALGMQARGLVELWPQRELSYHGLGGSIGHAVVTAERADANVVYVASGDGSPRHFGAGNLPGLRFPSLKWFDPTRSLPIPPEPLRAVYQLGELAGQPPAASELVSCLGTADASAETVLSAGVAAERCLGDLGRGPELARFGSLAQMDAVVAPPTAEAGAQVDTLVVWRPLRRHPHPVEMSLHLLDDQGGDPVMWGNGTAELYPASEWEPGERVLSRLPMALDRTTIPGVYPLTLGVSVAKGARTPVPATWAGGMTDRVLVGSIAVQSSGAPWSLDSLPPGMQLVAGGPLAAGGLELLAVRPPSEAAAPGANVRVGLLWRAVDDAPRAAKCVLKLRRADGQVVQQVVVPLLRGGDSLGSLRAGTVVRGEPSFVVASHLSSQSLALSVALLDDAGAALPEGTVGQTVATINVAGRQHSFESPNSLGLAQRAQFGSTVELLDHRLDVAAAPPGGTVRLRLHWRALSETTVAYKVFVHVLDQPGQRVVAQRDAEPQAGRAPTTSWLPGEVVEDEYPVDVPSDLEPGVYPIELGLYDPKTGQRLTLADGENRVILSTSLTVR